MRDRVKRITKAEAKRRKSEKESATTHTTGRAAMSEYADFIGMLREGDWDEGDVNHDDLHRAADIIERMEQQLADTVTECLAAKSNEDIMRKQLAELRELEKAAYAAGAAGAAEAAAATPVYADAGAAAAAAAIYAAGAAGAAAVRAADTCRDASSTTGEQR